MGNGFTLKNRFDSSFRWIIVSCCALISVMWEKRGGRGDVVVLKSCPFQRCVREGVDGENVTQEMGNQRWRWGSYKRVLSPKMLVNNVSPRVCELMQFLIYFLQNFTVYRLKKATFLKAVKQICSRYVWHLWAVVTHKFSGWIRC